MQAIAQKNARNRKKKKTPHTLGTDSLAIRKDELELRYGREYSRGDMYVVSHKDAKGKFVNEYASQKAELLQVEMQNTQCENEAFFKVFEKEHAGYVRSMGLGITPSRISSPSTRLASSSIESNEKMLKMQAEIDSLKEKASQVDFLKAQVAFLMQVQNSRDKEPTNLETRDGRHSSESSHRLEDH
ncbi:uncharacterized protein [Medicago truncatula]|uniref:uncharacterized protein n=1 Tax=Medicago truncatula TaxID=3880 RepID=UPI00196840BF|nr:uncharacterized protein LOC120580726 [Medicago truncatula]